MMVPLGLMQHLKQQPIVALTNVSMRMEMHLHLIMHV